MKHPVPRFIHRSRSGSFEAICTKCYRTIANESIESNLAQREADHQCAGMELASLVHPEQPENAHPKRSLATRPDTNQPLI
jgi:hypothetical protein